MGWFKTLVNVGSHVVAHAEFRVLLETDRDVACGTLSKIVEQSSREQLDQFEEAFLTHSIAVVGPRHRLRAIELYAYLKMRETSHYNQFRGFIGTSHAM